MVYFICCIICNDYIEHNLSSKSEFIFRYYRQHCTPDLGSYTKDLSAISVDLANVFILDNSPGAYRAYPGIKQLL